MPFGKRDTARVADMAASLRARAARGSRRAVPAALWMALGMMLAAMGVAMSTLHAPADVFGLPLLRASERGPSAVEGLDRVRDGDTLVVGGVAVRLEGLHCPERDEPGGGAATAAMRDLARVGDVRCTLGGARSRDRRVGRCVANGVDLGAAMIRAGRCARCPRFDPDGLYLPAQRDAGPWRGAMPAYC